MHNLSCPNCGSTFVIPVIAGLLMGPIQLPKTVIDESMIQEDNPRWRCMDCMCEWQNKHADHRNPDKIESILFESGSVLESHRKCCLIQIKSRKISWGYGNFSGMWKDFGYFIDWANTLVFTEEEWKDVIDKMLSLDILNWDNIYQPQNHDHIIFDGYSWSMVFQMQGIRFKKHGYNAYPPNWEEWIKILESVGGKELSPSDIQQILKDLKDPTKKMLTITMTNTTPRIWKPRKYKPWKQEEQTFVVKPDREIINRMIALEDFPTCPICNAKKVKQILYQPYSEEVDRNYYYLSRKEKGKDDYDWKCYFCGYRWYYDCNDSLQFKDIQKIHFEAGNCFDLSRVHYLIDFTEHAICWDDDDYLSFDPDHVYPYGKWMNRFEWDLLYQTLEKMRILFWRGCYDRICALDGYNWSMNIMTKDAIIQKFGANDQPLELFALIKILEEHTLQEVYYPNLRNME
jgi:hypothetical protein